jgi:hypothetical protein
VEIGQSERKNLLQDEIMDKCISAPRLPERSHSIVNCELTHFECGNGETVSRFADASRNRIIWCLIVIRLWGGASIILFADGAANRVYSGLRDDDERELFLPHCIAGDLDSIHEPVKSFYRLFMFWLGSHHATLTRCLCLCMQIARCSHRGNARPGLQRLGQMHAHHS